MLAETLFPELMGYRTQYLRDEYTLLKDDEDYIVEVVCPGLDPESLEAHVDASEQTLVLKGKRAEPEYASASKLSGNGRRLVKPLDLVFHLNKEIDLEGEPSATYKNGILAVRLSKHPKKKPKRIPIDL